MKKVINAISKLNSNGLQILLIINKQNNYVGTLIDGILEEDLSRASILNRKFLI